MNETSSEFFAELAFDYLQFELVIQKNCKSKSRREAIKVYLQNINSVFLACYPSNRLLMQAYDFLLF